MGAACFMTKEIFFSKLRFGFKGLIVVLSGVIALMFLAIIRRQPVRTKIYYISSADFTRPRIPFV